MGESSPRRRRAAVPWGNDESSCALAVERDCGTESTAPVGSKAKGASPYGALDMAGNVREWVEAKMDDGFQVNRGGSYANGGNGLSAAYKFGDGVEGRNSSIGFRCVRSP